MAPFVSSKRDDTLRWSIMEGAHFLAQSKKQNEEERGSLIRASTGSGDPEIPELPSARGYILASEISQSSTFGAPVFDHRSCPFSPSMTIHRHNGNNRWLILQAHEPHRFKSLVPKAWFSSRFVIRTVVSGIFRRRGWTNLLGSARVNGCTDAVQPLPLSLLGELFTSQLETTDALTSPRAYRFHCSDDGELREPRSELESDRPQELS
ncbi:hypothetical protein AVEN_29295-1 [Araneus ventricosus]|uniref:Uncharacterized protein n=1 Tax=Araneus ventricosus TaxID=182803 RepID=A0A4Y2SXP6_ARAVE|nr:hypothetical protein AVEN_29295-1 [Araneus ventricosus]